MTITFETINLPFKVGDTIYVNEKHGQRLADPAGRSDDYFQAQVEQIFFDGRLEELSVITEPVETYEMRVKTAIYVVKPIGPDHELVSMPIKLSIPIKEPKLFATEDELKAFVQTRDQIDDMLPPTKAE